MKPNSKNRKERAKEEKYKMILDAAETIIQREDLNALSINKVARQAKIAKGTVYIYFENKEEIIGELTVRARKKLLEYFQKYCGQHTDPIEKIKNIFWADFYFYKEHHTYHELVTFYEQNTGLKESDHLAKSSFKISSFVKGIIENAKSEKVIRQDIDSALQGFVFWGMAVGILQIIDTKREDLVKYFGKTEQEFYAYFLESAVAGLRP